MQQKSLLILSIVAITTITMGMSSKKANNIPVPAKNFNATVIDRDAFETTGTKISIDGEIFLTLTRGVGTYYIPFEKIKHIEFGSISDNWVNASVKLVDADEPIQGQVDGFLPCYGETSFGKFELKLKNIKKIIIANEATSSTN